MSAPKRYQVSAPPNPAPEAPSLSSTFGGETAAAAAAAAEPARLLALPSALHNWILAHLPVSDFVRVDVACRRLRQIARAATPGDSTICIDGGRFRRTAGR